MDLVDFKNFPKAYTHTLSQMIDRHEDEDEDLYSNLKKELNIATYEEIQKEFKDELIQLYKIENLGKLGKEFSVFCEKYSELQSIIINKAQDIIEKMLTVIKSSAEHQKKLVNKQGVLEFYKAYIFGSDDEIFLQYTAEYESLSDTLNLILGIEDIKIQEKNRYLKEEEINVLNDAKKQSKQIYEKTCKYLKSIRNELKINVLEKTFDTNIFFKYINKHQLIKEKLESILELNALIEDANLNNNELLYDIQGLNHEKENSITEINDICDYIETAVIKELSKYQNLILNMFNKKIQFAEHLEKNPNSYIYKEILDTIESIFDDIETKKQEASLLILNLIEEENNLPITKSTFEQDLHKIFDELFQSKKIKLFKTMMLFEEQIPTYKDNYQEFKPKCIEISNNQDTIAAEITVTNNRTDKIKSTLIALKKEQVLSNQRDEIEYNITILNAKKRTNNLSEELLNQEKMLINQKSEIKKKELNNLKQIKELEEKLEALNIKKHQLIEKTFNIYNENFLKIDTNEFNKQSKELLKQSNCENLTTEELTKRAYGFIAHLKHMGSVIKVEKGKIIFLNRDVENYSTSLIALKNIIEQMKIRHASLFVNNTELYNNYTILHMHYLSLVDKFTKSTQSLASSALDSLSTEEKELIIKNLLMNNGSEQNDTLGIINDALKKHESKMISKAQQITEQQLEILGKFGKSLKSNPQYSKIRDGLEGLNVAIVDLNSRIDRINTLIQSSNVDRNKLKKEREQYKKYIITIQKEIEEELVFINDKILSCGVQQASTEQLTATIKFYARKLAYINLGVVGGYLGGKLCSTVLANTSSLIFNKTASATTGDALGICVMVANVLLANKASQQNTKYTELMLQQNLTRSQITELEYLSQQFSLEQDVLDKIINRIKHLPSEVKDEYSNVIQIQADSIFSNAVKFMFSLKGPAFIAASVGAITITSTVVTGIAAGAIFMIPGFITPLLGYAALKNNKVNKFINSIMPNKIKNFITKMTTNNSNEYQKIVILDSVKNIIKNNNSLQVKIDNISDTGQFNILLNDFKGILNSELCLMEDRLNNFDPNVHTANENTIFYRRNKNHLSQIKFTINKFSNLLSSYKKEENLRTTCNINIDKLKKFMMEFIENSYTNYHIKNIIDDFYEINDLNIKMLHSTFEERSKLSKDPSNLDQFTKVTLRSSKNSMEFQKRSNSIENIHNKTLSEINNMAGLREKLKNKEHKIT